MVEEGDYEVERGVLAGAPDRDIDPVGAEPFALIEPGHIVSDFGRVVMVGDRVRGSREGRRTGHEGIVGDDLAGEERDPVASPALLDLLRVEQQGAVLAPEALMRPGARRARAGRGQRQERLPGGGPVQPEVPNRGRGRG